MFNNLRYRVTVDNQDQALSTLAMLINPQFDENGRPTGADIFGDFLVTRDPYAPPYPSHIGNSVDIYNPEYPGKERVIAGSILNGFDLSSWAQVPSGDIRIVFYARPYSETPFFDLDSRYRTSPLIDTVLTIREQEVYTLHILERDFNTKETGVLLRQENFHKLPLADSLVYVNFYNLSAKGFWQAPASSKPDIGYTPLDATGIRHGIRDTVNVFYSLFNFIDWGVSSAISSHSGVALTQLIRNTESTSVAPYHALPLFVPERSEAVESQLYQEFYFRFPGLVSGFPDQGNVDIVCFKDGSTNTSGGTNQLWRVLPNLIVTTHSGIHNPRSFGSVSSIEIVNGHAHLTTIQRVYDPPVY